MRNGLIWRRRKQVSTSRLVKMWYLPEGNNWKTLVCPVNWNGTTLRLDIRHFQTRLFMILWGGEFGKAVDWKLFWRGKWDCFHISKSFGMWHTPCRDPFNRMKLDRMIKKTVEIHSRKRTHSGMFLFAQRRGGCCFFLALFSPLSWNLEQGYLDLKECWESYGTEKSPHHTHTLCKGPWWEGHWGLPNTEIPTPHLWSVTLT